MIVGIEERESEERLATFNIGKARTVGDKRHLAQHSQRSYLGQIKEPLFPGAREEVFVNEVQYVVSSKRDRVKVALFQIFWNQASEIQCRNGDDGAIYARTQHCRVDRIDRASSAQGWSTKAHFGFYLGRPVF